MDVNPLFLLEFVLFSGVAVAWGVYEWWSVRPKKDGSAADPARHTEGEHRADDR